MSAQNTVLPTRRIGRSSQLITEIGLGCAPLGNLFDAIDDEQADATVESAIAQGIRYFDTAPYYGLGRSEARLGESLRLSATDQFFLSTKVGRRLSAQKYRDTSSGRYGFEAPLYDDFVFDYSYDGIYTSFESSLKRLQVDRIGMVLVHDLGEATHGETAGAYFKQFADSGYRALDELRASGQVDAIGLGVNECNICLQAFEVGEFDCVLLAGRYTLLEQGALDELFPACEANNTSIVIGGPYNSGVLISGGQNDHTHYYNYAPAPESILTKVVKLNAVCERHDVALPAAALHFVLAHPLVASVVPGCRSVQELATTLAWYTQPIPVAFWEELGHAGLIDKAAPVPSLDRPDIQQQSVSESCQ